MKIKQACLQSIDGHEMLLTWLDVRPGLKPGSIISLADFKPEKKWVVQELYQHEHDATDFDFHRKWDNNNYDHHKGLGV